MAKCILVICCISCILVSVLAAEKYTDKYDNIDVQEILDNKRLLLAYINCVLDKGKCTPDGKELKENLQDAIETGCDKCTEIQQKHSYQIIEHLIGKEKEIWDELTAKFDSEGKWRKKYEERARANGVIIPTK